MTRAASSNPDLNDIIMYRKDRGKHLFRFLMVNTYLISNLPILRPSTELQLGAGSHATDDCHSLCRSRIFLGATRLSIE